MQRSVAGQPAAQRSLHRGDAHARGGARRDHRHGERTRRLGACLGRHAIRCLPAAAPPRPVRLVRAARRIAPLAQPLAALIVREGKRRIHARGRGDASRRRATRSRRGPWRTVNDTGIALVRGVPHLLLRREGHGDSRARPRGRGGVGGDASSPSRRAPRVRRGVAGRCRCRLSRRGSSRKSRKTFASRIDTRLTKCSYRRKIPRRKRLSSARCSASVHHFERRKGARRRLDGGLRVRVLQRRVRRGRKCHGEEGTRLSRTLVISDASSPRVSSRPTIAASVVGRDECKQDDAFRLSTVPLTLCPPRFPSRRRLWRTSLTTRKSRWGPTRSPRETRRAPRCVHAVNAGTVFARPDANDESERARRKTSAHRFCFFPRSSKLKPKLNSRRRTRAMRGRTRRVRRDARHVPNAPKRHAR